ncbi:cupin domain-containing protein [Pseudoneobacillus sp. C159]
MYHKPSSYPYQWHQPPQQNYHHLNSYYYPTPSWNDQRTQPYAFSRVTDFGPNPFVINIDVATKQNNYFRTALWTGKHLQITLMSINVGESIGLEVHPTTDQFLRIEQGQGLVQMGRSKDRLDIQARVKADSIIVVPAGVWHNVTNTGNEPLKLYSIYAPPQHPHGTIHETKAIAMKAEGEHQD